MIDKEKGCDRLEIGDSKAKDGARDAVKIIFKGKRFANPTTDESS